MAITESNLAALETVIMDFTKFGCRLAPGNCFGRLAKRLCAALACACILFTCTTPAFASTTVQIYVVVNGVLTDETGVYSYHQQNIFDASSNLVGTVDANDDVVNSSGQIIGYIAVTD